jgi:hypothetical protein
MRPPLHLGDRRVDDGKPEETPISPASRAHWRELNLEAAARIRDRLDGRNSLPEVEPIPGGMGPPSAILDPESINFDRALWDRQARSAITGKYLRTRRKYTPSVVE